MRVIVLSKFSKVSKLSLLYSFKSQNNILKEKHLGLFFFNSSATQISYSRWFYYWCIYYSNNKELTPSLQQTNDTVRWQYCTSFFFLSFFFFHLDFIFLGLNFYINREFSFNIRTVEQFFYNAVAEPPGDNQIVNNITCWTERVDPPFFNCMRHKVETVVHSFWWCFLTGKLLVIQSVGRHKVKNSSEGRTSCFCPVINKKVLVFTKMCMIPGDDLHFL